MESSEGEKQLNDISESNNNEFYNLNFGKKLINLTV